MRLATSNLSRLHRRLSIVGLCILLVPFSLSEQVANPTHPVYLIPVHNFEAG